MAQIFFDVDGVLIRSRNPDRNFRWSAHIERDLGITPAVHGQIFNRADFHEILTGRKDFKNHIGEVLADHSLPLSASDFITYWLNSDLNWNNEILELATELKASGHALSIATNQDRLRAEFLRSLPEISGTFVQLIPSSDLGECKPNQAFYQRLSERYLPDTSTAIVIDDGYENTLSAQAQGFSAICFDPDLRREHTGAWLRSEFEKLL